MSDRHARIGFNYFRSEVAPLANVELAQSSPFAYSVCMFQLRPSDDRNIEHKYCKDSIQDYFHRHAKFTWE